MNLTKSESRAGVVEPDTPDCPEAEAIALARDALAVLCSDAFGWPSDPGSCRHIGNCAEWLEDDLEAYEGLIEGRVHPVTEFPELDQIWSGGVLERAIDKVTRDIMASASELLACMGHQA